MRTISLFIIVIATLFISCSNNEAKSNASGESKTVAVESHSTGGEGNTSGKPVYLNKQDFLSKVMNYEKNTSEWVYEGDLPAIIDFYADWCGPCKIAAPILDELAKEYEGRIHIYKVDTEKERELAGVFGIQSIPAFLIVPKEGKPAMTSGIAQTPEETKAMFVKIIEEELLKNEKSGS